MIDMLAILLSTGACLFVIVRAIALDRTLPWFEVSKAAKDKNWGESPPPDPGFN